MIKQMLKIKNYKTIILKNEKNVVSSLNPFTTKRNNYYSTYRNEGQNERLNKQQINERYNLWDFLAFEKNISFFSVSFYILLSAVLALHFYNNSNEYANSSKINEAKERERKNLVELENKRKM
ncbi:conserved Plasmodium protein, unknown function [Plasmodium malariae]|uniref:Uncharacterized protein n=2 Tax=Plasmodium malariae TaxID=5858 RepID=A0A1D3JJ11_PLAMA|nr:conserved Plasmodium protein, unknown function [Plasmodium malariae]SBT86439.1 conserved Plasmodium protein, unknown function [Plasmodium malariae]